ncbi:unnamed protein product [Didymodactylos carnosus]|uniref:Mvd1 C-terminal domain-containing protein n=1 Tax=Didymodactylos carnosus TaxID=1234261 RepID=A0A8S2GUZ2_9BILA|nr:unnamed protein product [Didymodactylos carnosus]CAF3560359.1 unnamed protein product [Didymodactylos carnosus]
MQVPLSPEVLLHEGILRSSSLLCEDIPRGKSIQNKDFNTFAQIVMLDSGQFHAICMDTYPPVIYLNEQSKHLINLVHAYNSDQSKIKVAYTFDAGPNPFCFIQQEYLDEFLQYLQYFYPTTNDNNLHVSVSNIKNLSPIDLPIMQDALKRIILTRIGTGSKILVKTTMT